MESGLPPHCPCQNHSTPTPQPYKTPTSIVHVVNGVRGVLCSLKVYKSKAAMLAAGMVDGDRYVLDVTEGDEGCV